ncbi:MAG: OmpA family protein [Reichenbachiella sp.]
MILLVFNQIASSQDLDKTYKLGAKHFAKSNYVTALKEFKLLSDSGYLDNDIASYLAKCYLELHQPQKAKDIISSLDSANDFNRYLLAKANYFTEDFESAYQLIQTIHDTSGINTKELIDNINSSSSSYSKSEGFVVQNFGPAINTSEREYSAVMYNDYNKLLYTSRSVGSGNTDVDGLLYETILSTSIDSNNNWFQAKPLAISLEHERKHDATIQVYKEGKRLISYHDGELFTSTLLDGVWTKDGSLDIHDFDALDTHCYMSEDEQSIIFASDYQSFGHDLDLFISRKDEKGKWMVPVPISELNTEYDEDAPFISGDSTLYFSSRGHGSMGGYDIFKSTYDDHTRSWSKPESLGHPINTVSEDIYYTTDGKLGYMSSSRLGGFGSLDLYRIYLFNQVKIMGYIINEENNKPIADVQIDLEYDSLYFRSYSDINGKYEMFVPVNKNMKVTFIKDSLDLYEGEYIVNVFFKDKSDHEFNFRINYSDEEQDPNAIANIRAPETTKELKIDVKNDFALTDEELTIAKIFEKTWADSITQANDEWHEEYLTSLAQSAIETPNNQVSSEEQVLTIQFESYSHQLNYVSEKILSDFIALGSSGLIYINGHSDSKGSDQTNKKLSILRAKAVYNYIVDQGYDPNSIIYKGFGSSKPLDSNQNEAAYAKNRRTEIIYYE